MENKQINNELLNIMGARKSKSNKRVNLVLVQGNKADNSVHYYTCSLSLEKAGAAEARVIKDKNTGEEFAYIKVKMLTPREEAKPEEKKDETVPF